jgi:hypothetical protein
MANVTEMPPPEAPETQDTPPETDATPQTPASPAGKKAGRPKPGPEPRFFDKVASVAKADWGTRAFMYVYADEPVCNAKTFGSTRYMLKSHAPILDLEGLKQDYGSFKGWMTLNLRKTGKDQTDEVDRYEFEIYDPKHPPKIPKSAWANDARNKKWLDLLPPDAPVKSDATASLLDTMKVIKEIKTEVREEMGEPAEPVNSTRETLETMKLAKELFAPAVAAETKPASDPLATAISLAQTMMQMKADNPMVEFMREQMGRQHDELMAMRKEMADARKAPEESARPKGFLETLIDFGGEAIKTRVVDSLFGGKSAAASEVVRPGRMNTLEFVSENLPKALDTFSPLIQAAAHKIMNPANGASANPGAAVQPAVTGDVFQKFITEIVTPKMLMYFRADPSKEGGEGFADWVYAGWPEHFDRIQKFSHPMMPGLVGEAAIITAYRNTPSIWSQIVPQVGPSHEAEFTQFVHGFCTYDPNAPEPDDPNIIDATPDGPEDLDSELENIN